MTSDSAAMQNPPSTGTQSESHSSRQEVQLPSDEFRRLPTLTFQETYAIVTQAKTSGNLADATDTFSQLVQGMAEHFGTPLHPEMGWVWLEYGRCLYQSGVANNDRMLVATKKNDETPEESVSSSEETLSPEETAATQEIPDDEDVNAEDVEEEDAEGAEDGDWQDEDEEGVEIDGADESDLEAAWQALETARLIFSSAADIPGMDEQKKRLMLAETYLALGDVSLEEEKFDQAIQDYRSSLAVREGILTPDDRSIAETLYLIALALENDEKFGEAINEMKRAVNCLEQRKLVVQQALQNNNFASSVVNDPKGKAKMAPQLNLPKNAEDAKSELEDLQALIPELTMKMKEIQASALEEQQKATLVASSAGPQETIGFGNAVAAVAPKPVADLTSMVKKKQSTSPSKIDNEEETRKRKMDIDAEGTTQVDAEKKPKL